jgi:hypothetical protein
MLAVAASGAMAQSSSSKESKELIPGAKLVHKFSSEYYVPPDIRETGAGLRLFLYVYSKEPKDLPLSEILKTKGPDVEMIVWDAAESKEICRMSTKDKKKEMPNIFDSPMSWNVTSDGKSLAYSTSTVDFARPEKSLTQVCLQELATRKSEKLPVKLTGRKITHMLVAPDGALVILDADSGFAPTGPGTSISCTVHEPGKDKPRQNFNLAVPEAFGLPFVSAAALSPDGSLLAVDIGGAISVYDLKIGKQTYRATAAIADADRSNDLVQRSIESSASRALLFSPSKDDVKLLAVEFGYVKKRDFVVARLFDLKKEEPIARATIHDKKATLDIDGVYYAPTYSWEAGSPFFTSKGEPRVLFEGKIYDATSGKVLAEFDQGAGAHITSDGKYLVRLIQSSKKKTRPEIWSIEGEQK